MENESSPDPGEIDEDTPPNLGEEKEEEPVRQAEGEPLEQFDSTPPPKGFLARLRELMAPLYVKVILSILIISVLIWLGFPTCSSPNQLDKKHYIFGLDPTWYPLQLRTKERNMTAFMEMLFKEIARRLHLRIDVAQLSTTRLFSEFGANRIDGVISELSPPISSELYLFSDPIYRLGLVLVVDETRPVDSLTEMQGKVVGLVGDARTSLNIDLYPEVIFFNYTEPSEAFVDLNNKKIDGAIMHALIAKTYSQGLYAGKFYISKTRLSDEGISLILLESENAKKFLNLFNKELKELRDEGDFARLLKFWQIPEE